MTRAKPRILLVDDEAENLTALERTLRHQFDLCAFTSPKKALELVRKESFAVVVSDQRMAEMAGTDFLSEVAKISPQTTRVILTAYTDTSEILDAVNRAEIYRYVTKPWVNEELNAIIRQAAERYQLVADNSDLVEALKHKQQELTTLNQKLEALVAQRTAELKAANEKLAELAMTDPLTNLWNRRAFFQKFNEELERSRRYKHTLCIAMMDIDHFKPFNDMEGHLYGDAALRKVAGVLNANIRKTDALGRYGGEEFILLMPETRLSNAMDTCERLRAAIEKTSFQGQKESGYLTISLGVAAFPEDGNTADELIEAADQALYQAKQEGRNRVVHERNNDDESPYFVR